MIKARLIRARLLVQYKVAPGVIYFRIIGGFTVEHIRRRRRNNNSFPCMAKKATGWVEKLGFLFISILCHVSAQPLVLSTEVDFN